MSYPVWLQYVVVISGMVGVDVRKIIGESRSSRSRDIRAAHFVMDERTNEWRRGTEVVT